jgi:hypothetical protein
MANIADAFDDVFRPKWPSSCASIGIDLGRLSWLMQRRRTPLLTRQSRGIGMRRAPASVHHEHRGLIKPQRCISAVTRASGLRRPLLLNLLNSGNHRWNSTSTSRLKPIQTIQVH